MAGGSPAGLSHHKPYPAAISHASLAGEEMLIVNDVSRCWAAVVILAGANVPAIAKETERGEGGGAFPFYRLMEGRIATAMPTMTPVTSKASMTS